MKKLIFVILFISLGFGQMSNTKYGVGLNIGDLGAGIFFHKHIKSYNFIKLGATVRWMDIRPSKEIPKYNYYTGQYENKNTLSLATFPIFGVISFYPFEGKIANNFSPFITAKAGPILLLEADEEVKSFTERWIDAKGTFTYGGNIGVGVEFRQPGKYHYSIEFSYDFIPLKNAIDFYDKLDGTVLSFSIHR